MEGILQKAAPVIKRGWMKIRMMRSFAKEISAGQVLEQDWGSQR